MMENWLDPYRILLVVAVIAVGAGLILFKRRPKISDRARAPENTATHPSQYLRMPGDDAGVGKVVVKKLESTEIDQDGVDSMKTRSKDKNAGQEELPLDPLFAVERNGDETAAAPRGKFAKEIENPILLVHLRAPQGKTFNGRNLMAAFKISGLVYGDLRIFHYPSDKAGDNDPQFSIVNMVEPGIFDPEKMDRFQTIGVTFFMRASKRGASDLTAFANMIAVAQACSRRLGGELLDDQHQPLTAERIELMRRRITEMNSNKPVRSGVPS